MPSDAHTVYLTKRDKQLLDWIAVSLAVSKREAVRMAVHSMVEKLGPVAEEMGFENVFPPK